MRKLSGSIAHFTMLVFSIVMMIVLAGADNTSSAQTTKKKSSTAKSTTKRPPSIPVGTTMTIRLETEIDSKKAHDGDKFTAIVISPEKYLNSTVEGHLAKVQQSGKMKGNTSLSLAFDRVILENGQAIPFAAQVVEISEGGKGKSVDEEGNVKSGGQGKDTAKRGIGGAGLGAIIGGIAGGGSGAAIGAAVGGGAGVGSTMITGSKKLKLESGTEISIKTTR